MRVGFGISVLSKGLQRNTVDGIGTYTRELAKQLTAIPQIELFPIKFGSTINEGVSLSNDGLTLPPYPLLSVMSNLMSLPFIGNAKICRNIDLFHATDHLVPRLKGVPVLATVMDAIPLSHPDWVRSDYRMLKAWLWRQAVRWADHVVTISEFSKREIVEYFSLSPKKVSVVPLGVNRRYFERIDLVSKQTILKRLQLPKHFFLFVGTLQPRKNVGRILSAHASLPRDIKKKVPLVIVGRAGWGVDGLLQDIATAELSGTVRWLKYLPDFETRVLMQSACALVFPSLYEGYGLPVVEAFASRLPVITSNTTALVEVAETAALMIDPLDIGAISNAMEQIIRNPDLADDLRAKGLVRAHAYCWERTAQMTFEIYKKLGKK